MHRPPALEQRLVSSAAVRFVLLATLLVACYVWGGCNGEIRKRKPSRKPGVAAFPIQLDSSEAGSVLTGTISPNAQSLRVGCASCHSLREGSPLPAVATELDEFHVGLTVSHGDLTCAACHNPSNVLSFRLADGAPVDSRDAIKLCSQCHGTQARNYRRGSHGGMIGHWDLSRGPRTRKVCTHCHDPHAPAYIGGLPSPPPRDRFLSREGQTPQ